MSERGQGRPHVVEVGLRWPPETFLQERFAGLAERGLRITVGGDASRAEAEAASVPGVELCRLPKPERTAGNVIGALADGAALGLRRPRRLLSLLRAVWSPPAPCAVPAGERMPRFRAWARLARLDPDVAHFEWNGSFARFLPVVDLWDCPVVCSSHGSDVSVYPHTSRRARARAVLAASFERADAFHVVSERLRREAVALGLDPDKAVVIENAVDLRRFRPAPGSREPDGELRIVSVGHLRWVKGYEVAVRALARLIAGGVPARLEVLGSDPDARTGERSERERIAYVAAAEGIAERVSLRGHTGYAEIPGALRGADVLLQSSVSEGLPLSVLEAMACEVPVVTTDAGALDEVVTDGVDGRVVPARSPEALAEALAELWADPDARRAMGTAGRRRVRGRFDLERQLDRFAHLYAALASGASAPFDLPGAGEDPEPEAGKRMVIRA